MEPPKDLDAMVGHVISDGLSGFVIQAELVTNEKRIFSVRERGKSSRKIWMVTIERYPYSPGHPQRYR